MAEKKSSVPYSRSKVAEVAGARKRTEAPPGGDGRAVGEVSQSLVILLHSNSDVSQHSNNMA